MPAARITLAAVVGAHGVGGEVRLKLFAQGVESLRRHERVEVGGVAFAMTSVRAGGQGAIAVLSGVSNRDAAEALRGQLVSVPRDALPPLGPGEYYHADIIGLACVSPEGEPVGTVVAIENFGAGDIIEIERAAGGRTMVPFRAPAAELSDERVVVDPIYLA